MMIIDEQSSPTLCRCYLNQFFLLGINKELRPHFEKHFSVVCVLW